MMQNKQQLWPIKNIDEYAAEPWSGYTDWKDVLFRNGSHQNYEVNAQGGNEKTRFYTSFAYTKQEGITNVSGYERFTGRANVNTKPTKCYWKPTPCILIQPKT